MLDEQAEGCQFLHLHLFFLTQCSMSGKLMGLVVYCSHLFFFHDIYIPRILGTVALVGLYFERVEGRWCFLSHMIYEDVYTLLKLN